MDVDHKSFMKQVNAPSDYNPPGRPTILEDNEISEVFNFLRDLLCAGKYPTIFDIQQKICEMFGKIVSLRTINRIIDESGQFKTIKGIPMDEHRVQINDEYIQNYFDRLSEAVNGVPVSLVYNIDEAGQDDYVDMHAYNVVVPLTVKTRTVYVPVRRETKRSTLLHCICADGTYTKPLLIIPRKTVDSVLLKRLCINNTMIKFQEKGYANTDLIRYWFEHVFFPELRRKREEERERTGYDGNAVLILDGFSSHKLALESFDLKEEHLTLVYLVPHSSHLTQPLDLVIFASQKLYTTKIVPEMLTNF